MKDLAPHLSQPWPPPRAGDDADRAIDAALNTLAAARHLTWLGDAPTEIHLLASLQYQTNRRLLDAIDLARQQDIPQADIAHLAGMPPTQFTQLLSHEKEDHPHQR